jgi:SAM-dependent methyltransferase
MNPDFWNEKFATTPHIYGIHPNVFLKETIDQLQPGKLLLPGEGEGRNALYAAAMGWKVEALDQSEVATSTALTRAKSLGLQIKYHTCTIQQYIPEADAFDALGLIFFHLPTNLMIEAYTKLNKALKPGGSLIIEGFGKNQLQYTSGGPKNLDMLYDMEEVKAVFPTIDWKLQLEGIVNLDEGIGHSGPAHVVRLHGIKMS